MDSLKEHWPKIAIGAVAIALSYYAYRSMAAESIEVDGKKKVITKLGVDGKSWPTPRQIISEADSPE